ncbi:MAG: sporulation protein [Chloroflexi bacterium]|nr:sporulation protein [Chloroflexota bacterium]
MSEVAQVSGGEPPLTVELDRGDLLPGRLVDGRLHIGGAGALDFREARVTLIGVETWRYDQTSTDAQGHPHTETRTAHEDLPHVPVAVLGPTSLAAGEVRDVPFQIPVPALGPPTFDGTELRVDWEVRANLDVPGFDPKVSLPVVVLQPTAALRAGVIDLGQFALWPEASVEADGIRGSIALEPVPLCVGSAFRGRLVLEASGSRNVQEVRLELRVHARSTVGGGRQEEIPLWVGRLAGEGTFGGEARQLDFGGELPRRWLPTVETRHGRGDARLHVVVATAWARDPHLVRDVAIASTTEL